VTRWGAAPGPPEVILYTDGACSGNPGPGGWAAIVLDGDAEQILAGAEPRTTNQRMELRAALEGLRALSRSRHIGLYSDSTYLVRCFRDGWWLRWERDGWVGRARQPVANRDLWEALIIEARRHHVAWHWVRGHNGDALNERADRLAREALARLRTGPPSPP
jgi:ribonuclease HI